VRYIFGKIDGRGCIIMHLQDATLGTKEPCRVQDASFFSPLLEKRLLIIKSIF
jgi:hypothetical protein